MGIPNIGSGQIAIQFGMTGPNFTTVSACATGGHALGESSEIIRRGDADLMVAGGSEAGIYEPMVGGFAAMRALSTRNDDPAGASRPFDTGRDGFVIGEGAGVVVLEELGHAEARGAAILGELVGYGATADASHITLPAPGGIGAVRAARIALDEGGPGAVGDRPRERPRDLDARGRQVRAAGDPDDLRRPRVEALDHGQQVDARPHARRGGRHRGDRHDPDMRDGCVPPTINLDEPDPAGEGLDLTANVAARRDVRVALSNSFGFGGQNTALIFASPDR